MFKFPWYLLLLLTVCVFCSFSSLFYVYFYIICIINKNYLLVLTAIFKVSNDFVVDSDFFSRMKLFISFATDGLVAGFLGYTVLNQVNIIFIFHVS